MKKVYKKPTAEIVVLNLGEQITWGELANPSNNGTHTEAKEIGFEEEEEKLPDYLESMKLHSPWDEDEE